VCGSNRHGQVSPSHRKRLLVIHPAIRANDVQLQLGMGHDSFVVVPTINPALRPASMTVLKVSCGTAHTAVLVDPGRLFMMGWYGVFRFWAPKFWVKNLLFTCISPSGEYGRLGFGDTRDVFSPQELVIYPGSSTSARQPCVHSTEVVC
jgi:alpha-tubulin suppressor-like RCC1 family protein